MFRRRFLQVITLATAGGLAPLEAMATGANTIVTFHVRGFSCIEEDYQLQDEFSVANR
jgi:hypothetical protein